MEDQSIKGRPSSLLGGSTRGRAHTQGTHNTPPSKKQMRALSHFGLRPRETRLKKRQGARPKASDVETCVCVCGPRVFDRLCTIKIETTASHRGYDAHAAARKPRLRACRLGNAGRLGWGVSSFALLRAFASPQPRIKPLLQLQLCAPLDFTPIRSRHIFPRPRHRSMQFPNNLRGRLASWGRAGPTLNRGPQRHPSFSFPP